MTHADHTSRLTEAELGTARSHLDRAHQPLQRATLEARLRTNQRISTAIKQGRWHVCLVLYRIGRTGRPVGQSRVHWLTEGLPEPSAVDFIKEWTPNKETTHG